MKHFIRATTDIPPLTPLLDDLPVTVMMDVYPYELEPETFAHYLDLCDKGINFVYAPGFSFADDLGLCIITEPNQYINDGIIRYIRYFFEDSDCPLVFVPVLGESESLPQALSELPPGGICDDFSLLTSFHFICAVKTPFLYEGDMLQAAKQLGYFGVINKVTAKGETVYRTIHEPVPFDESNPYEVIIDTVTNYYEYVEIAGTYHNPSPNHEMKINASTDIILYETTPQNPDVVDGLPEFRGFCCRLALVDNNTRVSFKSGRRLVRSNAVQLPEDTRNYDLFFQKNYLHINKIAMRPYYKVSCIIPVYNAAPYINETVDSIISQTLDFFPHIQIVLVNDGSTDDSPGLCKALASIYPYNVVYVQQPNKGASAARNAGRRYAMGEYILFVDADDTLDANLLSEGVNVLQKNTRLDFVVFPVKLFGTDNLTQSDHSYRFGKNGTVDINTEPEKVQFSAASVLMRTTAINGILFDETLTAAEDAEFVARVFADKPLYAVCKDAFYNYRIIPGKYGRNLGQYGGSALFAEKLAVFSIERFGIVTPYIQHVILRDITRAFGPETDTDTHQTEQIETAKAQIITALSYVDDTAIAAARKFTPRQKEYLLYLKHGKTPQAHETADIFLDYMLERDGFVVVRGYLYLLDYTGFVLEVCCETTGAKYIASLTPDTRVSINLFGCTQCRAQTFTFRFPLPTNKTILRFHSRVHYPSGFALLGKEIFGFEQDETICLTPVSQETASAILKNNTTDYMTLHPLLVGKRIFLFVNSNPLEKNTAAYLYDYCITQPGGIDCRMVVPESEVPLYPEGTAIAWGSKTHTLMSLFAEKTIVSDIADIQRIRDLTGLTVGDYTYIPGSFLTGADRTKLTQLNGLPVTAVMLLSPREVDHLPEGVVRDAAYVTGNPVFDTLADRKQPRILFMPDFRKFLHMGDNIFNPNFGLSQYAISIGDILLEERFLDVADSLGISVDFAPHNQTYLHLSELEYDSSVTVIPPGHPRFLLCQNAALLITDTLPGDTFAYLNKPVLYYNFDPDGTLPQDGAVFGETATSFDELIDLLIYYMQNHFAIKPEYHKTNAVYFPHRDGESRKRIYEILNNNGMVTHVGTKA
jgi:glycosyltransferase involved in cell wall biosynthesis